MIGVSCKDKMNCWLNKIFEIPVDAGWPYDNASTHLTKEDSYSTELISNLGYFIINNQQDAALSSLLFTA
jgi:hypothetical protein